MAPSLTNCADEILILILHYIRDQKSLLSLIQCSHRLHNLALPHLYALISIDSWLNLTKLQQLVHRLAQAPTLASHVRHLELAAWSTRSGPKSADAFGTIESSAVILDIVEHPFVHALVRDVTSSEIESKHWLDNMRAGNEDPWIALLLPLLRNLQDLDLTIPWAAPFFQKFVMGRVAPGSSGRNRLSQTGQQPPLFENLRRVAVAWYDTEGGLDVENILPLFELRSMRELCAHMLVGGPRDGGTSWPERGSSGIEVVELTCSNGMDGMLDVLDLCANLKVLRYWHADGEVYGSDFNVQAFRRYIEGAKNSLESLWVDYADGHYALGAGEEDDPLGSLVDFGKLRSIRIRDVNLMDVHRRSEDAKRLVDFLPKSLETLYLTAIRDPEISLGQLKEVADKKPSRLPHLADIVIDTYEPLLLPENLQTACTDNAINLRTFSGSSYERNLETLHPGILRALSRR